MRWIEVITARLAEPVDASLIDALCESISSMPDESLRRVECFYNTQVESDLAIHLVHESARASVGPSDHGQRLAATLEELGLVHHATWAAYPESQ